MSRFRIAIGLILLAIIVVAGYFMFRPASSPDTARVERGSIDVTIDTVGTIQLKDPEPIRSEVGGTIAALGAAVGDEVEAGDIIVLLEAQELDQLVSNAERALEGAEFGLQFSERRLDDDQESLDLQQNVIEALARVDLANETLADAKDAQAHGAIVADSAGIVVEIFVGPGDRIGANQPVAQIYASKDLILMADIDELDLPNVNPGASVRFRLDSYPAEELQGTVTSTAPQSVQRGGATLFPAEVAFVETDLFDVRPGMNADVTIVTDLRENVLLVPERAIRTVGQRAFVMVERSGEFEEVEVILGYRSGGFAEVVDGLEESERVRLR
jgi:RND family efflux transporter MFP subunit